jgi:hypothetical protein
MAASGMTFDELLEKIALEPPRTSERDVRVPSPLMQEVRDKGGMLLTDFLSDPRQTREQRTVRTGHVVGPPASVEDLARWRAAWPRHRLPTDLVDLLRRADGIHLWADLADGWSYEGLAPLAEWELARVKMWGPDADPELLADRYLALSYHADGAAFVVLNVDTGGRSTRGR